jgi:hypothetical protein
MVPFIEQRLFQHYDVRPMRMLLSKTQAISLEQVIMVVGEISDADIPIMLRGVFW